MARRRSPLELPGPPPSLTSARWSAGRRVLTVVGVWLAALVAGWGILHAVDVPTDLLGAYCLGTLIFAMVFGLAGGGRLTAIVALVLGVTVGVVFALPSTPDHGATVTEHLGDGGQGLLGHIKDAVHHFRDGEAK